MTATIIDNPSLRNHALVFEDRDDAGRYLARSLNQFRGQNAIIMAIPSGGVPVGLAIASCLKLPFDLLIIRKIPVPGNTESGFGAISLEGDMVLNEPMVKMLGLSRDEIERLAKPVIDELQARNHIFRRARPWPELKGKIVILVDDGLASGYTMMTAVQVVRRLEPLQIVVAVPTASASTVKLLAPEIDLIVCPNIRSGYSFAVADAYRNWYDLSRKEVVSLLEASGFLKKIAAENLVF